MSCSILYTWITSALSRLYSNEGNPNARSLSLYGKCDIHLTSFVARLCTFSRRRGEACSAIVTSENSNQSDSIIPEPASASCNNDNSEPIGESGGASRTLTRTRSSSRMKQSQTQAKCNNSSKRRSESYKPKTEDQCLLCNRNIKSKAAHCETGNHWVHYHCD